jgi:hypothetical protein
MLLISELAQRGMLERDSAHWRITIKGNALAIATAAKQITRATTRLVQEFCARVIELNRNERFLFRVREARVFGSYLTDVPRLSDVDLALDLVAKHPSDETRFERYMDHCHKAEIAGHHFNSYFARLAWPEVEVWQFLKSRARGLSLHMLSELESLGTISTQLFLTRLENITRPRQLHTLRRVDNTDNMILL